MSERKHDSFNLDVGHMPLAKVMEAQDIKRWTIVPMSKTQSVAEHSFNVVFIADCLYSRVTHDRYSTFERHDTLSLALCHDLAEVYVGDIPATMKDAAPLECSKLEEAALPTMAIRLKASMMSVSGHIVKVADYIEGAAFLSKHMSMTPENEAVFNYVVDKLAYRILTARHHYKSYFWGEAVDLATELVPSITTRLLHTLGSGGADLKRMHEYGRV